MEDYPGCKLFNFIPGYTISTPISSPNITSFFGYTSYLGPLCVLPCLKGDVNASLLGQLR